MKNCMLRVVFPQTSPRLMVNNQNLNLFRQLRAVRLPQHPPLRRQRFVHPQQRLANSRSLIIRLATSELVSDDPHPNHLPFFKWARYRIIKRGDFRVSNTKKVPLYFGPIPAGSIQNALKIDIEEGDAVMSFNAQTHARKRHPTDYARCLPHVAAVINTPLYARDDFKNAGKIELVGRPGGMSEYLLVAVELTLDTQGRYNVTSFYPISEKKVQTRRESGHLIRVILI